MAEDIAHYKRCQWNKPPDYSFDWLGAASCRRLAQKGADYMQDALSKGLNGSHKAAPSVSKPKDGKGNNGEQKGNQYRSKAPGGDTKPKGDRASSKLCAAADVSPPPPPTGSTWHRRRAPLSVLAVR